ncbi:hypothetical protein B0H21DRAFT_884620 [Amylocystis lapponica]|nr:hypothetical protein B0H21DRAFT_884620 [Amylocystis lapponica]
MSARNFDRYRCLACRVSLWTNVPNSWTTLLHMTSLDLSFSDFTEDEEANLLDTAFTEDEDSEDDVDFSTALVRAASIHDASSEDTIAEEGAVAAPEEQNFLDNVFADEEDNECQGVPANDLEYSSTDLDED